jgi:hypothetical protein
MFLRVISTTISVFILIAASLFPYIGLKRRDSRSSRLYVLIQNNNLTNLDFVRRITYCRFLHVLRVESSCLHAS